MKRDIPDDDDKETLKPKDKSIRLERINKRRSKRLSRDEIFEKKWK